MIFFFQELSSRGGGNHFLKVGVRGLMRRFNFRRGTTPLGHYGLINKKTNLLSKTNIFSMIFEYITKKSMQLIYFSTVSSRIVAQALIYF